MNLRYPWHGFDVLNEAPKSVTTCENGAHCVCAWICAVQRAETRLPSPYTGIWTWLSMQGGFWTLPWHTWFEVCVLLGHDSNCNLKIW